MILMLQKEVADRIVARDKKESILSIAVKVYGAPHIVKKVPARYFTPAPKVDSAVLAIENISNKHFTDADAEKRFFEILRTGFAHKRKKLAGNLRELFGGDTLSVLTQANVNVDTRAEDITLNDWLAICKSI
jgi:16S rRNA (adenine1518-N6/adenine1519-N6)-dimethyltransferase